MNRLFMKKFLLLSCCTLLVMLGTSGCYRHSSIQRKTSPVWVPNKAEVSIYYDARGEFFIVDQNGNPIIPESISFEEIIQNADIMKPGWLKVLGSYTMYQVGDDDSRLWLCDKDFNCFENRLKSNQNDAIFSINYNGESIFLADAEGQEIQASKLKPIGSLVQTSRLGKRFKIRTLDATTIYQISSVKKIVKCTPNNICRCICKYSDGTKKSCRSGTCPN